MVPTVFAREGRPELVLGSPGGLFISNVVLQIAVNCVDFGMNINEAVNAKRIHHGWLPDYTSMEEGVASKEVLEEYKKMGHKIYDEEASQKLYGTGYRPQNIGTAMCIQIDWENHVFYGAADPRSGDPSALSVEEMN
jgi:gamma-glutamyltranspeptidase/glutathione hydrolase